MIARRHLAAFALLPVAARAQTTWSPDRPIGFQVGFPAGGTIDYVARLLARDLGPRLGQNVVVENRTGASGNLATQAMVRAPADGLTIGFAAIHLATNPALMPIGYDPQRDIAMLTQISAVPVYFLASAKSGLRSVADVVARGRANPGGLNFGSGGVGTSAHLAAELFSRNAGFTFTHIPFRGGAPSMQALLAGKVDCAFTVAEAAIPGNVAAGRIQGLAVMQPERLAAAPDVPSIVEAGFGPDVFISSWHGIMLRAGTPEPIRARLFTEIAAAMQTQAMTEGLARAGITPKVSANPAAFADFVAAEAQRWTRVIRAAGITSE